MSLPAVVGVVLTLSLTLCLLGAGSSQTSGFPSLEELRRNGSLLERYSTHDGELRSVPGVRATCSTGNQRISKITFIALPGSGMGHTQLLFGDLHIDLSVASNTFGDFGYELTLPMTINIGINEGPVQLSILHPPYEESGMRLLHQVGTEARNICWRLVDSASESENCHHDYDYPLLAIETEPPGCVEGLVTGIELRMFWSDRYTPVLYSSPERTITLNCTDEGEDTISRILVGAYSSTTGDEPPQIVVGTSHCNVSMEPLMEGVNVYECVIDPPAEVESLEIRQRNASSRIGFLHDGLTETPLISVNFSGHCDSSQSLSKEGILEAVSLTIPNITERDDDDIEFEHTQPGYLVSWSFVGRSTEGGENFPELFIAALWSPITIPIIPIECSSDTHHPNVYECRVEPHLVDAGWFVGVCLPPFSDAKVLLSFIFNGSPPGESLAHSVLIEGLPLVSLKIFPLQTPTPSTASVVNQTPSTASVVNQTPSTASVPTLPSNVHHLPTIHGNPTPHAPTTGTTSSGDVDYVIPVVTLSSICLLIILIVSVTTVILVVWFRRRRDGKNITPDIKIVENEAYQSVKDREILIATNPAYATTSCSSDDKDITTSTTTAISTTENPAYAPQASSTNTLVYDYARV